METITETITGLRVSAQNNYTLTDEQDETAWRHAGPITQVAVAIGLDEAAREGVQRRGYSGSGAGAHLLATIDGGDEEEIENMGHALVRALPVGDIRELRHYIHLERGNTYWDGNNFRRLDTTECDELLDSMRAQ